MIFTLQRSLIILLVLLQLVAPLVHAHSGQGVSPEGIHLPGLEFVTSHENENILTISSHSQDHGAVISVSSGIQHKNFSRTNVEKIYLLTKETHHNAVNCQREVNCLPEGFRVLRTICLRLVFPRAPPA